MITIPVRSVSFSFNRFVLKEKMVIQHKCQLFLTWYAPPIHVMTTSPYSGDVTRLPCGLNLAKNPTQV